MCEQAPKPYQPPVLPVTVGDAFRNLWVVGQRIHILEVNETIGLVRVFLDLNGKPPAYEFRVTSWFTNRQVDVANATDKLLDDERTNHLEEHYKNAILHPTYQQTLNNAEALTTT